MWNFLGKVSDLVVQHGIRIPQTRPTVNIQNDYLLTILMTSMMWLIFQASNSDCFEPKSFWPRSTPTTARPSFDHWHSPTLMPAAHRTQYLEGGDNAKTRNWNILGGSGLNLHRKKSWAPETSPCVTCKHTNARKADCLSKVFSISTSISKKNMSTKTPDPSYHGWC